MFKSNSFGLQDTIEKRVLPTHSNITSVIDTASKTPGRNREPSVATALPATTSKVPLRTTTPSRGFFKKLFRTPGKSAVKKSRAGLVITPSNQEKLGFVAASRPLTEASSAVLIRRSNSNGVRTDFSGAITYLDQSTSHSTETEGSASVATKKRVNSRIRRSFSPDSLTDRTSSTLDWNSPNGAMPLNSSPVARRLLADEDLNSRTSSESGMGKLDSKAVGTPKRQSVEDALLAASRSPERSADLIFVAKSSSSSEADDSQREQRNDVTPSKSEKLPMMRSQGISIPTPAVSKWDTSGILQSIGKYGAGAAFTRPLRKVEDSPAIKTNLSRRLESLESFSKTVDTMSQLRGVDEDEDAFLPDDFQKPAPACSEEEIERRIEDAKKVALDEVRRNFDQKVSELEQAYDQSLMEHGLEWRREREAERERLTNRLNEEKTKTSDQRQQLLQKDEILEDLQKKLAEYEAKEMENAVVQDEALLAQELYKNQLQEKIVAMEEHVAELQNEKSRNDAMACQLQLLQQSKDAADIRLRYLENKLQEAHKEAQSKDDALARLECSEKEILSLKSELSKESKMKLKLVDDLEAAKTEIDSLLGQRFENEKEMQAVRSQMERVDEQYRAVLYSPKKTTGELPPESPCSQVDILRIDNEKVHEQLKAMGKVLKRYKSERDEMKANMVLTVECAVKHAKEDLQKKLIASTEELKRLTTETEEIKSQFVKTLENVADKERTIEEMASRHDKENHDILETHRKTIEKFQSDSASAESKLQEHAEEIEKKIGEYEELQKQIERMQELHKEEVELVQQEAVNEGNVALETQIEELQSNLALVETEKTDLKMKLEELETRFGNAKAQFDKEKQDTSRRLQEMQSHHRKEIDELTTDLDLFEAENMENIRKLQESLKEKETVISAMGSQLAESEARVASSSDSETLKQRRIEELEGELQKAVEAKSRKEQELADQVILKQKAIEEVANELTAKAEKQFEERNELYRVLKKKFDEATSHISVLERDIRFATKEVGELKKRHEAREGDLKDELAQTKAAVAKSDANLARVEKNHRAELQRSREELDSAKATSQQIQKSLAIVVNEKEKLAAEVVDLKNISEELMAMVEEKGLA